MTYKIDTLDNGLRVASERLTDADTAAFAIAIDVGARHEHREQNGLSHMLEHMIFKGTRRMNAKQIAEAFDLMGGNVNAYTSHEHTVYYAKVLKEYADDALRLLCEILADSVYDPIEIDREREVILQEIAMHHDTPDDLVFDLYQQMAFGDTPLGRSILGDPERIKRYTRDDLINYTRLHYQPSRIAIAGAGAVDHAQVMQIATEFFGNRKNEKLAKPVPTPVYLGGEKTLEKDLEQVQLAVGFHGIASTHDDYYASQVFTTILGGGMSSRLFQEIREKRGLAYSVSAYSSGYNDIGVIGMYAGTTVEHLPELTVALKEVMASIQQGIGAEELLRAKNQLKANVLMSRESTGTIVEWIARHLLVYGRYRTAPELVATIDAITQDDVVRLAHYCLGTGTPIVAALGPVGSVNDAGLAARLAA
ncbi:M16 family metallopeptidase [Methylocystis sp.]|uniref:M16 family metallopeptidase n=1 Tax=Methylocystis sp. TaxID=1911079 RepID=UPI003DA61B33